MADTISKNKVATITYVISGEDGNMIEQNDVPVGYVHGVGSDLLPALENALDGHKVGDVVEVTIPPEDAFGEYDPELTFTDSIDNVPEEFRHIGAQAEFQNDEGETRTFIVTKIDDQEVVLDGNHPYADETIKFSVTVHEIRDASEQEIASRTSDQALDVDVMDADSGTTH